MRGGRVSFILLGVGLLGLALGLALWTVPTTFHETVACGSANTPRTHVRRPEDTAGKDEFLATPKSEAEAAGCRSVIRGRMLGAGAFAGFGTLVLWIRHRRDRQELYADGGLGHEQPPEG